MGWGSFFSWHDPAQSSIMESHLRLVFPGLALTNFSVRPPDIGNLYPWPEIHVGGANAAPLTKSWLPTTHTQCGRARGPAQLRLTVPARPESLARNRHFLRDPDDVLEEAPSGMLESTHWWCLLEYSDSKKRPGLKPTSDETSPKLELSCVGLGPNVPCSGLAVSYWVSDSYRRPSIAWECTVPDPFDSRRGPMEFGSMIHCGDKFYAISLQGAVAVIEVFDTRLRITAVGSMTRGVPSSRSSRFFKEYLAEMKGEILLVFLIHHESLETVDDVEILRLDLNRLDWIKVERLRGKTMFLNESRCDWVESAEFGCRDNCVFFTEGKENKWRVYDFKKCCISSVL